MTWLITSDTHLTDRPRDAYRFGLFPWLARQQKKHNVTATFILGDITDSKDKHSSTLVNRLVEEITGLRPPVYILMGNHDYVSYENPFFKFLSCVEGISFVTEPTWLEDHKVAMIPHQPDQASFDAACSIIQPSALGVMIHQTVDGALGEATGHRLTGLRASLISQIAPYVTTLAGDLHAPQKLQCGVEYVGAPYRVRFGDTYTPRVMLIKGSRTVNLQFPCLSKHAIRINNSEDIINNEELKPGDQVRVTLELPREEAVSWAEHKQDVAAACKELGLEIHGFELLIKSAERKKQKTAPIRSKSNLTVLNTFCESEDLPNQIKQVGIELIENA